ncbi:hypothetical protein FOL47_008915 [Perkinsus chesapeaki]|uniref:Uncharacterized protein n=1 Tax=Perkinsus chesapeaki TaxID=330153 RepID=A0A7J6LB15_PERCH|nr:hypothetical protein FOL47_008915 [Perkinsus chesapeaki]
MAVRSVDVEELLNTVGKTRDEIQNVKTRITAVAGKLGHIKSLVAATTPGQNGGGMVDIEVETVKSLVAQAKEDIQKFKSSVKQAAEQNAQGNVFGLSAFRNKMANDDKSRTLYERVGGDLAIVTAVDIMYSKAIADARTRAYLEKNQRKMSNIKKKLHQFLSGFTGGPVLYDSEALKPAHYNLNLTDYHFDAILELFDSSFTSLNVHPAAKEDLLLALGKVRRDITAGCTVRMETAKRSLQGGGEDYLFRKLRGKDGIAEFMDRVYEVINMDNRLNKFFKDKNINKVKAGQTLYFTELFGGEKCYDGNMPGGGGLGRDLVEIHKDMEIDDFNFDCFLMDCEKALSGLGYDDATVDEVLVLMEPIRASVLNCARGIESAQKMVKGKSVLERLGGEMNIEAVVETMHMGCRADPRVKYFFDIEADKQDNQKTKIGEVLIGLCGGAKKYDLSQLQAFHFNMNITDFHFDAVLENIHAACGVLELDEEASKDFLEVVGKVRSDITKGCTVRYEIAMQKAQASGTDGLFEQLGGDDGIEGFVDDLYQLIQEDPRIKLFFSGSKLDTIKASQGEYIAQLLGSPVEYIGRPLERVHAVLQVSDYHFDAFLELCRKALLQRGLDESTTDECAVLLETERSNVVNPDFRKHDARATQAASREKSLFDRLGGGQVLSTFVSKAYDKAIEDPRLRSLLEKNKARITTIKDRMTQYIALLIGGPSKYDAKELRPAHYGLNVNDRHFDAMLGIMLGVLIVDMGIDRRFAREVMKALQPVRTDVTIGCTVRMQLAKERIDAGKEHLFIGSRLGKEEGITKLVNEVVDQAATDPRIKSFFAIPQFDRVKQNIGRYILGLLGGPQTYEGKGLFQIHEHLGVNDYHFDAFLTNFHKALIDTGVSPELVDEVYVSLEQIRQGVLGVKEDEFHLEMKGKDDDKTLVDRLGGDQSLEALVEDMYDRAKADTRVRYFFEKGKAKQKQIRMKMYQYLSGAFGGPVQYDPRQLRPAHYLMNITNYHFDAVCESLVEASKEIGVDSITLDDVFLVVNRTRSDITTGCMVRMEVAQKEYDKEGKQKLFEKLGGHEGLESFITRLYECIERDKRINGFFEGSKLKFIKQAQSAYITMVLGGPTEYKGRNLESLHSVLAVTDYHFDCFMQQVGRSFRDLGIGEEAIDEAVVRLESIRPMVLHGHYAKTGYIKSID